METADLDTRQKLILDALSAEIDRQAESDLDMIDLVALAVALDRALGGDDVVAIDEPEDALEPDELNAANDV